MATLYHDEYQRIQRLGADETLVLSHLAYGYDESQIGSKLEKRRDRDTSLSVSELITAIYEKLDVHKEPKHHERRRLAGKMFLDFEEMIRERTLPRPGSKPLMSASDSFDDDMPVRRDPPPPRNGLTQAAAAELSDRGAPKANGGSLPRMSGDGHDVKPNRDADAGPRAPTPTATLEEMMKSLSTLSQGEMRLLRALSESTDLEYVMHASNLAEQSVRTYSSKIYQKLGIGSSTSRGKKRRLAVSVYQAFAAAQMQGGAIPAAPAQQDPPPARADVGDVSGTEPKAKPEANPVEHAKKSGTIPISGTVVTLNDPASVVRVMATPISSMDKHLRDGFRLEHIVVPPEAGIDTSRVLYILVKRTS